MEHHEDLRFQFPCSMGNAVRCMIRDEADYVVRSVSKSQVEMETCIPLSNTINRHTSSCNLDMHLKELLGMGKKTNSNGIKKRSSAICEEYKDDPILNCLSQLYKDIKIEKLESVEFSKLEPKSSRHPCLAQLYRVCESNDSILLFYEYEKHTLQDLLIANRRVLYDTTNEKSTDVRKRFLIYQLLQATQFIHLKGITVRDLKPANIFLTEDLLLRVGCFPLHAQVNNTIPAVLENRLPLTERWCNGSISNFEYLMALNIAAGRKMADSVSHPVLPWVIDFTLKEGGWRDLTRSKFRLNKGDRQLDLSYENSHPPHHITESLSEITYYIYMARRTPMDILKRVVRKHFNALEYPSSMQRMYLWTPDECIPEFFMDASAFRSLHPDMDDLGLPPWCETPDDFIQMHREALESDTVSKYLHYWIDLNFGISLQGENAVRNKNVTLKLDLGGKLHKQTGFVQLFSAAHPPRTIPGTCENQNYSMRQEPTAPFSAAVNAAVKLLHTSSEHLATELSDTSPPNSPMGLSAIKSPRRGQRDIGSSSGNDKSHLLKNWWHQLSKNSGDLGYFVGESQLLKLLPAMGNCGTVKTTFGALEKLKAFSKDSELVIRPCYDSSYYDLNDPSRFESMADLRKAVDVFAVGCIIAEIYLSSPLFSSESLDEYFKSGVNLKLQLLPPAVRTAVTALLHPDPQQRSTIEALLSGRVGELFPKYFEPLFQYMSRLDQATTLRDEYILTESSIESICELPLVAMDLILSSLLELFRLNRSCLERNEIVAMSILRLFPHISMRLQPQVTREELFPLVISFYERVEEPRIRLVLLSVPLLFNLLRGVGADGFLKSILPQLFDWIKSKDDHSVRCACAYALGELASVDGLGPSLAVRFIVPGLVQQLGRVRSNGSSKYYTADALLAVMEKTGEMPICLVVIPRILSTLKTLGGRLAQGERNSTAILDTIHEELYLVQHLMPYLSDKSIVEKVLEREGALLEHFVTMTPYLSSNATRLTTDIHTDWSRITLALARRISSARSIEFICPVMGTVLKIVIEKYFESTSETQGFLYEMAFALYYSLQRYLGKAVLETHVPFLKSKSFQKFLSRPQIDFDPSPSVRTKEVSQAPEFSLKAIDEISNKHGLVKYQHSGYAIHEKHHEVRLKAHRRGSCDSIWLGCDAGGLIGSFNGDTDRFNPAVQDSFRAHSSATRAIAVDATESVVITGSKGGTVRAWRLSDHPVSVQSVFRGTHPTISVCSIGDSVVSCDKSAVHVWDLNSGRSKLQYSASSTTTEDYFTACQVLSDPYHIGIGMIGSNQEPHAQVLVSTTDRIECLDIRDGLHIVADWKGSTLTSRDTIQTIASCGGTYLGIGCSTGTAYVLDQRTGQCVHTWRAHENGSILKVLSSGSNRFATISSDRTGIVWNIETSRPTIEARIRGLPDNVDPSAIILHQDMLYAASGSKIATASLAKHHSTTTVTVQQQRTRSGRLSIKSLGFLPLRQLLLLGTEDGSLKACKLHVKTS